MQTTWTGRGWQIQIANGTVTVRSDDGDHAFTGGRVAHLRARRSMLRWRLCEDRTTAARLRGLRRSTATELQAALRRAALEERLAKALEWDRAFHSTVAAAISRQRWVPREQIDALRTSRPDAVLIEEVIDHGVLPLLSPDEREALIGVTRDLDAEFTSLNEGVLRSEMTDRREFFERIEKSPLTDEQIRAVVSMDNRVHLLAAAGSGKTSVMIARAAYAVHRGFVHPNRILLLAFNKAAAAELQDRIEARFEAAGLPHEGVRASTFHSFGLSVIGRATGRKPRLAPWLESGGDVEMVEHIVDNLRDSDRRFRHRWDLFRLLFAAAPSTPDGGTPDSYDPSSRTSGFITLRGETVRSGGERMIADWLYLNGVDYRYEQRYSFDVADEQHSQYRPDFYYPAIDVWHEHWALDADGKPPAEFKGYAQSISWKRNTHASHGTTLIETTFHDVVYGDGLERLAEELTSRGITLDWNPDRPLSTKVRPLRHSDLARLIRTFMAHVKSNSFDEQMISERARTGRKSTIPFRTQIFLDLYWPVHHEWNRRLQEDGSVDFEDMLQQAARHLESGEVDMGYELVLVDEFQDASQARARMVRGLVQRPGRHLLAVGDDWQAINRFAGADISVMLRFEDWFGQGPQLSLTTTFRCPQTICDVAAGFVMSNPRQFKKSVRSAQTNPGAPITLIRATDAASAIERYLKRLSASAASERAATSKHKVTVDILGRYSFDIDCVPSDIPQNLAVTFRTAHGSKGLEADYVVIPRAVSGRYGFPSEIADDPVLDLAMAEADEYPNAEDRRLFYVALTRARRAVTIVTEVGRESSFVTELLRQGLVVPVDDHGATIEPVQICPDCGAGTMVRRKGPYGEFLGCSRFPACRRTINLTRSLRPDGPVP